VSTGGALQGLRLTRNCGCCGALNNHLYSLCVDGSTTENEEYCKTVEPTSTATNSHRQWMGLLYNSDHISSLCCKQHTQQIVRLN